MRTSANDLLALAPALVEISIGTGREILQFYGSGCQVNYKADGSRVTEADHAAHNLIVEGLEALRPRLPILSEESKPIPAYEERSSWRRYWLVDPIDGTNGFIRETDQFTVNIALIEGARPVLGVIHLPVYGSTYWAARGSGAYLLRSGESESQPISVREFGDGDAIILGNRSRGKQRRDSFVDSLARANIGSTIKIMSSSMKFCRVAEGAADVYTAFGYTSEWDTAAGQCIVECAGGRVTDMGSGDALQYNKPQLLNPWFIASGGGNFSWRSHTAAQRGD